MRLSKALFNVACAGFLVAATSLPASATVTVSGVPTVTPVLVGGKWRIDINTRRAEQPCTSLRGTLGT